MKIFNVVGTAREDNGEHLSWIVKAFQDKAQAEDLSNKAQHRARELVVTRPGRFRTFTDLQRHFQNEWDPMVEISQYISNYYYNVAETELA